jgi:peptide/nickel transport system permease protein
MILRRLAAGLAVMVLVSFGIFALMEVAPGSTEQILVGPRPATPELLASLRAEYHLDDPFLLRYVSWLEGAVGLDFGTSTRTGESVSDALGAAAPITFFLGVYAFVLAMVGGVTAGILAALRRDTLLDRGVVGLAVLGVSTPAFAMGIVLLFVFAVQLQWFPSLGAGDGFADRFVHLTLPALALALGGAALVVKLTRASMIAALDQDFVTFAEARGLTRTRVLFGYSLRNALMPIVSAGGLILGYVITGTVLVEVTFGISGLGSLLVEAVQTKDVPVVQAVALLFAAVVIAINLLVDVLYLSVDPRVSLAGAQR